MPAKKTENNNGVVGTVKAVLEILKPSIDRILSLVEKGTAVAAADEELNVEQKRRWGIPNDQKVKAVLGLEMLTLRRRAARASAKTEAEKDLAEAEAIEAFLKTSPEIKAVMEKAWNEGRRALIMALPTDRVFTEKDRADMLSKLDD